MRVRRTGLPHPHRTQVGPMTNRVPQSKVNVYVVVCGDPAPVLT